MSLLEEKMYGFITQPDNWQVASVISDKMAYVKDRMLKEFWAEVKKNLENRLDLNEWKILMSEDIYEAYSQLFITNASWDGLFKICFEELEEAAFLGVCRDFDSKKVPDSIHEQIQKELTSIYKEMVPGTASWVGYFEANYNFADWSGLDKILPSNRQTLVDKYSNMLLDLKDKAKPIIDEAMKQITAGA